MRWLIAALCGLLLLSPATAAAQDIALPIRIDRGRITVRAQAGMAGLANEVANKAPRKLAAISADLEHLPQPKRIEIRLVKRSADIGRASPPGYRVPNWAAGVAFPRVGVVVVATRRKHSNINVTKTVAHELAHLSLGAALRGRAPRWLDEGFAYLHSSEWSMARWRTLVGMAWTGNVIDWRDLDASFPAQEQEAAKAYAQSYDLVAFLAHRGKHKGSHDDGDRWPFQKFLQLISKGLSPSQAARVAYISSMDELHAEWYQRLRSRYLLVPAGLFALGIWVLGAILLIIAYIRRKRINRARLAKLGEEEAAMEAALSAQNV